MPSGAVTAMQNAVPPFLADCVGMFDDRTHSGSCVCFYAPVSPEEQRNKSETTPATLFSVNLTMSTSKKPNYRTGDKQLAGYAKALGHPARVAILRFILQSNSCICGDIVEEIGLSQSTISQHLKVLKETGIIEGEINGPSTCYCINEKVWRATALVFEELFSVFRKVDHCG